MSSIEVVDVNNETKTEGREAFASLRESPVNNEVVEQNETVDEPTPEEVIPEPKAKAKALPRTKKEVELVECEQCSKKMTLNSLRHSHPKNCKGAPTELLPVNPQKNIRKIQPEVKEIKIEIKQEVIKETIKKPTATELLTQHYEELKQKKKQEKTR